MGTATRVLGALLAVAAAGGWLSAQEATLPAAAGRSAGVRLGAADNGRRLELRVGQTFTLELRANFSTGYSWQVVSSGAPVIRRLGEPTFTPDDHRAGAGGTLRYEFRAERTGTAELKLVYVRPWEKDAKPADAFSLTVVVTK